MAKQKAGKEPVEKNDWICETCKSKVMSHTEMMVHLKDAHKLDPKNLKCSKKMLMHTDGSNWFGYSWEIKPVGSEITLINNTVSKRSQEDQAYWN